MNWAASLGWLRQAEVDALRGEHAAHGSLHRVRLRLLAPTAEAMAATIAFVITATWPGTALYSTMSAPALEVDDGEG